jgi:hypothetical protein
METLYKSSRLHLARAGYIVFGYYTQVSDMEALAAAESAFKKVAREHGRLVTVSYLSGRTVTQPVSDEVKLKASAILRGVEGELITNVMVVAGEGLGVTILRAFMTAFFIFSKLKRPQKCVGDVASALAFIRTLDPKAGSGVTADTVERFFGLHRAGAAA